MPVNKDNVLLCEHLIYDIQALAQASYAMAGCEESEPMYEAQRRVAMMMTERANTVVNHLFGSSDAGKPEDTDEPEVAAQ